jgi:hypothetical protein
MSYANDLINELHKMTDFKEIRIEMYTKATSRTGRDNEDPEFVCSPTQYRELIKGGILPTHVGLVIEFGGGGDLYLDVYPDKTIKIPFVDVDRSQAKGVIEEVENIIKPLHYRTIFIKPLLPEFRP